MAPPGDPAALPLGDVAQDESAPTPDEQEQYDKVVTNALDYLSGEGGDAALERMQAGDPVEAIGKIAAQLGQAIVAAAAEAGVQIDDGVLFHAGREVVEALVDLGKAAGLLEGTEQEIEKAFYVALQGYGEGLIASGTAPGGQGSVRG